MSAIVAFFPVVLVGCGGGSPSDAIAGESSVASAASSSSVLPSSSVSAGASGAAPVLDPAHPPPYIDHVGWVDTAVGPSLQIYPTPNGRASIADDGADVAWREVLALAPDADRPGIAVPNTYHDVSMML